MSSLRESVATLPRFAPGQTLNISDVADFVRVNRPFSVVELMSRMALLPDSVPFQAAVVTGAALGGHVSLVLNRDGSSRFHGFMRATGLPSFKYRVSVMVRSASGLVTVATQHSGEVFGSDTPGGRRQDNWDEIRSDPEEMKRIRNVWPDISGGTMSVTHSSELSGVLAAAEDLAKDVVEILLVAETLGASLAVCLVIGSELGELGATVPGLGGVVGLGVVAGSVFIWGPLAIGPAILIGVAAGAVVDAMIKIRRLTESEMQFARVVFGDSLDFDRIRLTNLSGLNTRPFTFPAVDDTILLNMGNSFDSPATAVFKSTPVEGQLFIHELTHAWQIQHASLEDGYVPGWLCNGIGDQITKGSDAYVYGPAGPPWRSFSIEGQASIVDNWFAGKGQKTGPPMDEASPYFGYIDLNIRGGIA